MPNCKAGQYKMKQILVAVVNNKKNALVVNVDGIKYVLHNVSTIPAVDNWSDSLKGFQYCSTFEAVEESGSSIETFGDWLPFETSTHELRQLFQGRRRSSTDDGESKKETVKAQPETVKVETTPAQPQQAPAQPTANAAGIMDGFVSALAASIAPMLPGMISTTVESMTAGMASDIQNNVLNVVTKQVAEAVEKLNVPQVVTLRVDNGTTTKEVKGLQHEKLQTIIKLAAMKKKIYMYGPAGTGKNVIAKQVAEALDLKFYSCSQIVMKHELIGYCDANGNYIATDFYRAFTNGGLFFFDELDSSCPDAVVAINQAIENRYLEFPGQGMLTAHNDFRVIAAGNTCGVGATAQYTGRAALDASTLNRFMVVNIDYSPAIENAIAPANVVKVCRDIRSYCAGRNIDLVVSYRTMTDLADALAAGIEVAEALNVAVYKYQLTASQVEQINNVTDAIDMLRA